MDKKIAELKMAAMILLTQPHEESEPYAILKSMEERCYQIVETCFKAGYRQRDGELIINQTENVD
jgi:hypothetical protein